MVAALLLFALVIAPVSSAQTDGTAQSIETLIEEGHARLAENRFAQSIALFEQAAQLRSDDIELFYWLGLSYWYREQGPEAIAAYRRAVELDLDGESEWSLYALENLAEVLTRTDHAEESRRAYLRARERETRPEWIEKIDNQLAELALTLGEYVADEQTVLNEAGEIIGGVGPGLMRTNRNFEIARHSNHPPKEEEYYRRAIATDPSMYQSYFNLALAILHQGRYREAIPWLLRSNEVWKQDLDSNPDGAEKYDAHAFLALCHLELGELDTAQEHATIAVAVGPNYFWSILYGARVQAALGNAAEALETLQALLIDSPEEPELLHALALSHAQLGDEEAARKALTTAIELIPPDHPWMVRLRAEWAELEISVPGTPGF